MWTYHAGNEDPDNFLTDTITFAQDNFNTVDILSVMRDGGAVDVIQRPAIDKQLIEAVGKYAKPESVVIQLDNALIPRRSEGVQNRFVVEGNYKYKFNNGFIAMSDTHAACMNFVNALEKIPGIIAQYEECTAKLNADVPTLEGIVAKTWGKEEELKQLKSDLAALDRKITAELAPKHDEKDGDEVKHPDAPRVEVRDDKSHTSGAKESMVAEPSIKYKSTNIRF